MEYLLLVVGFVMLLFGGKFLVKSGVALANRYNVPPLVIGLTVVSFGTSAPELFVSLAAVIKNHPEVAIGNVIGSNIANISLVLALTAIIFPIPVRGSSVKLDAPFMIIISLLFWGFIFNLNLSRLEGITFIALLFAYTFILFLFSKKNIIVSDNIPRLKGTMGLGKIILLLFLSDIGLAFGSVLLVENAGTIAANLGVDERIIAISLIAFGTSLPELTTSVIAAFKKEMDISIGNIIGSNIFNILAVLGISSIVKPIRVNPGFLRSDIFWMMGASILLFVFILPFKGGKLTRGKAIVLFSLYCVYLYILYFRTT